MYDPYLGASAKPAEQWLQHGYAVVSASLRGTGCSQGEFVIWSEHEGPDGADIVDWIGHQPWSNQKVGMTGDSYPGITSLRTAAERPKYLKAIAPGAILNNAYADAVAPGGIVNAAILSRWGYRIQPMFDSAGAQMRSEQWGDKECDTNRARHKSSPLFELGRAHPLNDDFWQARSFEEPIARIEVPTFLSQAWQDHHVGMTGALTAYRALKATKKIAFTQGGHQAPREQKEIMADRIRWMDRWLKGEKNGIDTEVPVSVYWETRAEDGKRLPGWVTSYSAWPPAETETRVLYLVGDGKLSSTAPTDTGPGPLQRSYSYPVGVELVGSNAQFSRAPDPTGALTWRSAVLDDDVTLLGAVQVSFYVSSEGTDADFVVALHDVYPNGDTQYLQRGFLRASMRRVDESRSASDYLWRPFDKADPLIPGEIYEIRMTLPAVGAVLRKGHKLEVALLAPAAIPQPEWGMQPVGTPARNTVYSSSRYPSQIRVPVIPGQKAQGPTPACGSLEFQPCRPADADQVVQRD
jgi:putative CocE/NonD family hydrolase